MKDRLKFYAKLAVVWARGLLLGLSGVKTNHSGWEDRVLIINLDYIGDLVAFTGVLKHYRPAMPGKKLYLLVNGSSGLTPELFAEYVDEIIPVDTKAFKSKPGYGAELVKKLRHIGFATVIEHNPGVEFVGKTLAVELGAKELIGYHGFAIDDVLPPSENFALGLRYFRRTLSKKFTKIIPTISEPDPKRLAHMLLHHAAIFEGVTGRKPADLIPRLPDHLSSDDAVRTMLREHGLEPGGYALFGLGVSTPHREWAVERYVALGEEVLKRGIPVVAMGGRKDIPRSAQFTTALQGRGKMVDLTGQTSVLEAASLIHFAKLAVSGETSIAHFTVAFKRPSLCIMWLAHFGRMTLYGYPDINRWVYKKDFPCLCDNSICVKQVGQNDPAPCVAALTAEEALAVFIPLLDHISQHANLPKENFSFDIK